MRDVRVLTLGLMLASALPVAAQSTGTIEVGGFGSYTSIHASDFEASVTRSNRIGGGPRLGVFVAPRWSVEISAAWTPTDLQENQPTVPSTIGFLSVPLDIAVYGAQAIWHTPVAGGVDGMLGAGPTLSELHKGISGSYLGAGLMAGLRFKPLSWAHVRLESTANVIPSGYRGETDTYLGLRLGGSILIPTRSEAPMYVPPIPAPVAAAPRPAPVHHHPAPRPAPVAPTPPAPAPQAIPTQVVLFEFDRTALTRSATGILIDLAASLKADPTLTLVVVGHTDWIGAGAYNMRLAQARAEVVRNFFVQAHGIAADRIRTAWRGEDEPAATNETAAGRGANRRVVISDGR